MIRGLRPLFFILKYEHMNNDSYDNAVNVPGECSYHNRIRRLTKLHHGVGVFYKKVTVTRTDVRVSSFSYMSKQVFHIYENYISQYTINTPNIILSLNLLSFLIYIQIYLSHICPNYLLYIITNYTYYKTLLYLIFYFYHCCFMHYMQ